MQTSVEFMIALDEYYGGFQNKAVAGDFENELRYILPKDLTALLKQIKSSLPAAYKPDLKVLAEAIKAAKITPTDEPNQERVCPSCGKRWYTSGICPWCCFDPSGEDSPAVWRQFVADHKAGKVPHYDVAGMLTTLCASKHIEAVS